MASFGVLEYAFKGHERCPECNKNGRDRSGNNLGRWEDGHAWCFSCGYWEPARSIQRQVHYSSPPDGTPAGRMAERWNAPISGNSIGFKPIPDTAGTYLAWQAQTWLNQYGIDATEVKEHKIVWDQPRRWLIFPYFSDGNNLVGWQARSFDPEDIRMKRKWFSFGDLSNHPQIIAESNVQDPIVIVEDIISAIKVGRQFTAMPLLGSHFHLKTMVKLRDLGYERAILWLDSDKREDSRRIANRLGQYIKATTIETANDPKVYLDSEILELVAKADEVFRPNHIDSEN
jgi:hypothetical protein